VVADGLIEAGHDRHYRGLHAEPEENNCTRSIAESPAHAHLLGEAYQHGSRCMGPSSSGAMDIAGATVYRGISATASRVTRTSKIFCISTRPDIAVVDSEEKLAQPARRSRR
jgi:hypothetical protein